jgi:hypothetical protein
MQWLRFCSRLAFICNTCFLLAIFIRHSPFPQGNSLISLIIILGYPFAFFFNALLNICYLFFLVFKKNLLTGIPRWLMFVNFLFLILEMVIVAQKEV